MDVFLHDNPVFSIQALVDSDRSAPKRAVYKRLRYLEHTGKVASVVRGVYSVVPPGQSADTIHPDPFLVLQALRPDVLFCGHSALDLQGVANSVWNVVTAYSHGAPNSFSHKGITYRTIAWPKPLSLSNHYKAAVDRKGKILHVTGPELTLVEGFRYPNRVGGVEELVNSADSFRKLDRDRLKELLDKAHQRKLYAAIGWFLSRDTARWKIDAAFLDELRRQKPTAPVYLERGADRSFLAKDWNLMIPRELTTFEGGADTGEY